MSLQLVTKELKSNISSKYGPWGSENARGVDLGALGLTPGVGQCGSGLGEVERASSGAGT